MTKVGGIIVCGGLSTRMGRPKAWLPFGSELMLPRIVRILSGVVSPIVVVAAAGQELPPLPDDVGVLRDELEDSGPLAGLAVGLRALQNDVDAVYVSSCDVPLLKPEFVQTMIDRLGNSQIAIPREGKFHHPLAAVYRTSLASEVQQMLAEGLRRPFLLLRRVAAIEIDVEELREVDPHLQSLRNTNSQEDFLAALHEAGLPEPEL